MQLLLPTLVLQTWLLASVTAQQILELSTLQWTLRSENGSISVPGSVPSLQYLDLLNAGVIEDPLYGMNNEAEIWVSLQNWTYAAALPADLVTAQKDVERNVSTLLVFQGLDTYAHISVCGMGLGDTDNQFRQWILDASSILKGCGEEMPMLEMNFGSAVNISNAVSVGVDEDGESIQIQKGIVRG